MNNNNFLKNKSYFNNRLKLRRLIQRKLKFKQFSYCFPIIIHIKFVKQFKSTTLSSFEKIFETIQVEQSKLGIEIQMTRLIGGMNEHVGLE